MNNPTKPGQPSAKPHLSQSEINDAFHRLGLSDPGVANRWPGSQDVPARRDQTVYWFGVDTVASGESVRGLEQ